MKSNLAILSSNKKSIDFVNELGLVEMCNLYANCSRNIIDAEKFSQKFGFTKYYGSYEDLINDQDVDIILNFLPSGIKFEYSYLCLKKGKKVITDYPIINSKEDLPFYEEIISQDLIHKLFLIDNCNVKKASNVFSNFKRFSYFKNFDIDLLENNSLSNVDILYELSPDLFFLLNKFRNHKINLGILDIERDKITKKINFLNCHISIDSVFQIYILLNNGHKANEFTAFNLDNENKQSDNIENKSDLFNFIKGKKPFDNLSEFQYYPFKLFQEVINE